MSVVACCFSLLLSDRPSLSPRHSLPSLARVTTPSLSLLPGSCPDSAVYVDEASHARRLIVHSPLPPLLSHTYSLQGPPPRCLFLLLILQHGFPSSHRRCPPRCPPHCPPRFGTSPRPPLAVIHTAAARPAPFRPWPQPRPLPGYCPRELASKRGTAEHLS
jgi:hypothetical protein